MTTLRVIAKLDISRHTSELEVEIPDDATEEQKEECIIEAVTEWSNNYINLSWKEVE